MSVKLQDWIESECSHMEAGTILTGIRGNDLRQMPEVKKVVRWMRCICLVNGNSENDFMQLPDQLPTVEEMYDDLEYATIHYFTHFLHTLEVIAYRHPHDDVADIALNYYTRLVSMLHLSPEPPARMVRRLSGEPGTSVDTLPWVQRSRAMAEAGNLCPNCFEIECICEEIEAERQREAAEVAIASAPKHAYQGRTGY